MDDFLYHSPYNSPQPVETVTPTQSMMYSGTCETRRMRTTRLSELCRMTFGVRIALRKTSFERFTCCTKTSLAVWPPAYRLICALT